jgi:tetratricopeptide (TPR) repeat protein
VLWEKGRREEARDHFAEAVRIRRPFLEYQIRAANEALSRGAVAEAIPHFVRVLMLTPWNSELHQDLGTLLVRNGEPGKALGQFHEALRYRPDWVQPRLSISEVLIAQGQQARAQGFLQEVLRADPENSRAKDLIALLSKAEGKTENAGTGEITSPL